MEAHQEEEISIVDLLAVLLKYRKLIAAATLGATILSMAVFFLPPALGLSAPVRSWTVKVELTPILVPENLDVGMLALGFANQAGREDLSASALRRQDRTYVTLKLRTTDVVEGDRLIREMVTELERRIRESLPEGRGDYAGLPLLAVSDGPTIQADQEEPFRRGSKMTAVVFFAALFVSIFLAFVLEYMSRVRGDPEAMDKLKRALGGRR